MATQSEPLVIIMIMGQYVRFNERTGLVTSIWGGIIITWGRLNIKILSYQYRDPYVKDKTALRQSYL